MNQRWRRRAFSSTVNKVLGVGQFGRVIKGEARDLLGIEGRTIVAVKMLKETADIVQRKALLGEIKIMAHIGQHLNVVNLLGAVTKNLVKGKEIWPRLILYLSSRNVWSFSHVSGVGRDGSIFKGNFAGELYMLTEYCRHGSLRDYLQNHQGNRFYNQVDVISGRLKPIGEAEEAMLARLQEELLKTEKNWDGRVVTTRDLISYSYQISNGMEYLVRFLSLSLSLSLSFVFFFKFWFLNCFLSLFF